MAAEPLYSAAWYRVADLAPRLRRHARLHRHAYRGQVWYVLEDTANGRCHRLSQAAHQLVAPMDGTRSVQQLWEQACTVLGDDAPTQDETIRLLGQLHAADLLLADGAPDTGEVARRSARQRSRRQRAQLANPLAIRIPLFDPDRLLSAFSALVRPLFSPVGLAVWALLVASAAVLAAEHWGALTDNLAERVLTPQNLLALWLAYPLVKGLHELGHGFAARVFGAPVHEIGVMLLVLMPVPYVEASAASALADKGQRMVVGAAGIMVELLIAALALFVWLAVEPGLVRTLAWNLMLIGGVSTLLFNGNPLLRFDGYYVLADWLEIPNLATRANQYLGYLVQRHLFGVAQARSPVTAPGEAAWFVGYGVAAFCYRLFILFVIVLFIGSQFFIIGVLLALWAVAMQVVWPLLKQLWFLLDADALVRRRWRAAALTGGGALLAAALVGLVPLPAWTRAEGVVWTDSEAHLRADTDAFITRLAAADGAPVVAGEALIETDDPALRLQGRLLDARRAELSARLTAAGARERADLALVREEIAAVDAELALIRARLAALTIRSPRDGVLILPDAPDLPGRFVHRGEVLGQVSPGGPATVRVAVGQGDIALVRGRTRGVTVWPAGRDAGPVAADIARLTPAATAVLPAAALGSAGGGRIAVDPADPDGTRALTPVFLVDLRLPESAGPLYAGTRVAVRFDHGREPLATQWWRALRRLLLGHFGL